jgi:hypothetical protein
VASQPRGVLPVGVLQGLLDPDQRRAERD